MWTDLLAAIWPALPMFFFAGLCFVLAGGIWLVAIRRHELAMGPDPVVPSVAETTFVIPSPPAPPNYHRPDADTGVVPRIPGATRQPGSTGIETDQVEQAAGPVCPVCGGPFHPVCPSAPKERTDEITVALPAVALAPQYAALDRFFKAVGETRTDTDQAMHRLVENVRPDCPLTTQEIETPLLGAPEYDAAIRNTDTRELSEVMKKVSAP